MVPVAMLCNAVPLRENVLPTTSTTDALPTRAVWLTATLVANTLTSCIIRREPFLALIPFVVFAILERQISPATEFPPLALVLIPLAPHSVIVTSCTDRRAGVFVFTSMQLVVKSDIVTFWTLT